MEKYHISSGKYHISSGKISPICGKISHIKNEVQFVLINTNLPFFWEGGWGGGGFKEVVKGKDAYAKIKNNCQK